MSGWTATSGSSPTTATSTHSDPAVAQDDLTELLEPDGEEPFILHPGEFVLGSTLEVISLGDDLAVRLEGKALALSTEIVIILCGG